MAILIATPKAIDANSYLTVARADQIMALRLYTEKWDQATGPTFENYQANGAVSSGVTQLNVDTGTGTFSVGSKFKFAGHATEYTVSTALSAPGLLKFTPALTANVADNEVITRLTANEKEKGLIWSTRLLDSTMDWFGAKRTLEQSLRWPRSGVLDEDGDNLDYDTIPVRLEEATAELALGVLEKNKFKLPGLLGQGFSEATLGPMRVVVDKTQQEAIIPDNILSILSSLGVLEPSAQKGTKILKMLRS